jgi:ABC-type multidrug transport system fused ATPase/permease subunit
MVFETLGVGLIVPVLALLTQPGYTERLPLLKSLLVLLGNPDRTQLVAGAVLGLTAVFLLKNLFLAFVTWKQMRFAFAVQAQLSQHLFTVYLRQPYTFHLQRNSAGLLRNITGEVSLLTNSAILPGLLLMSESLVLVGLCLLLLIVEPVGAVVIFSVLGVSAWGFYRVARSRITRWGEARQHHETMAVQHLQQGLGGAKDVKILGREAEFLKQYRVHNERGALAARLQMTLLQFPRLWLEVLAVVGLSVLVLVMLLQGRAMESVLPTLGLFAATAFRVMPSVNRALGAAQSLRYGLPVIDTLYVEANLSAPVPLRSLGATAFEESIELRDVTFTYQGAHVAALANLSLKINRGESVGFIGTSGAGKSTLVDLLLGLVAPVAGEVLVDGRNINSQLRDWQDQIGYVPQTIFLTDDTLKRNIAFGLPDDQIDDVSLRKAMRAAQLDTFLTSLPLGVDTIVGERGVRLSGGQRQRIGIARALYHDPPVLVLDEATSSLDTATERGVMEAVAALHGDKTIVIVAHRFSTVEHCDRLYRLEFGRLADSGTPTSMLHAGTQVKST